MATDVEVIVDPAEISTAVTVATSAPVASVVLATGTPGPSGANGAQGPAGSDASVTSANITTALGYTPDSPTASRTPTAHTHTKSQITDFPTLATVATSGAYADLTGKPSIPTTSDALTEGTTNLYFTSARAVSALASTLASYATQAWVTAQGYATTSGVSSSISSAISALVTGVSSVAGKTGAVTLAKADVGLGNADNTSDANKPISTATQTAITAVNNRAIAFSIAL